jgi:hypothetical protein
MSSDEKEIPRFTMGGTTIRYRGVLALHDHGEAYDVLFLDGDLDDRYPYEPLAETISDDLDQHGRHASVRYWTADMQMGDDALIEASVRAVLGGEIDAEYAARYSDVTGYLWTDEDIMVGGHDLLEELKSQAGRYLLLEINYSKTAPMPEARL